MRRGDDISSSAVPQKGSSSRMILRLSVCDTATGSSHDVEMAAEPDSSVASLLAALPVRVDDRPCYVGSALLDPDTTVGASPLVAGAVISVGAPGTDHHPP